MPPVTVTPASHDAVADRAWTAEECKRIQEQDELLGIPVTQFNLLDQAKEQLTPYEDLWTLVSEFRQNHTQWVDGPVFSLNAEQVRLPGTSVVQRIRLHTVPRSNRSATRCGGRP